MKKQAIATVLFSVAVSLGMTVAAQADVIVAPTFDASNQASSPDTTDYEGVFEDGAQAPYDLTIGTFEFVLPSGSTVLSATISGTFGDANEDASALADLYVLGGSIKVAACDDFSDDCFTGGVNSVPTAWSYTFTPADLTNLATDFASGSLDFTAVQNSPFSLVVGDPVLDLQVSPEPASILTLAGGLLALAGLRRCRK